MGLGVIFLSAAAKTAYAVLKRVRAERRSQGMESGPEIRCIGQGETLALIRSALGCGPRAEDAGAAKMHPAKASVFASVDTTDGRAALDILVIDGRTGPAAAHAIIWRALPEDARLATLVLPGPWGDEQLESALALTARSLGSPVEEIAVCFAARPDRLWLDDLADKLVACLPSDAVAPLAHRAPLVSDALLSSLRIRNDVLNAVSSTLMDQKPAVTQNSLRSAEFAMDASRDTLARGIMYPLTEALVSAAVLTLASGYVRTAGASPLTRITAGVVSSVATDLLARGYQAHARRRATPQSQQPRMNDQRQAEGDS